MIKDITKSIEELRTELAKFRRKKNTAKVVKDNLKRYDNMLKECPEIVKIAYKRSFTFTSSILSCIMNILGRLSGEIILWNTAEMGYIKLSDSVTDTSSAMPQKKNPDPLELMKGKSAKILGQNLEIFTLLRDSENYRVKEQVAEIIFDMETTVKDSLNIMRIVFRESK